MPGWFQLADTLVLLGEPRAAIDAYRRALAIALQNPGVALLAVGEREQGVLTLETALDADPPSSRTRRWCGSCSPGPGPRWGEVTRPALLSGIRPHAALACGAGPEPGDRRPAPSGARRRHRRRGRPQPWPAAG